MEDFGAGDDMRFEREGKAAIVTLTRPKALNALTHDMIRALARALQAWEKDDAVACVVVRGEGRAFCAGGDILRIYEAGMAGRPYYDFFADEYRLNAAIARFPKPYVSLIDGIVMGGGVGISFHGSHPVVTENAVFAMPETGIGFFPDVGGSHLLSRVAGEFGLFLALTASRVKWGDIVARGLAPHAVGSDRLQAVVDACVEDGAPDAALRDNARTPEPETAAHDIQEIAGLFDGDTLQAVLADLEAASGRSAFAAQTLAMLRKRSPTSVNVAFRQIREGRQLGMDECMKMEFRILCRMLKGHDLYEGIRTSLIEKGSQPQWRPATFEEIVPAGIEAYFEPLGEGELTL